MTIYEKLKEFISLNSENVDIIKNDTVKKMNLFLKLNKLTQEEYDNLLKSLTKENPRD